MAQPKTQYELVDLKGYYGEDQTFDLSILSNEDFNTNYQALLTTLDKLQEIKTEVNNKMKEALRKQYLATGKSKIVSGTHTYIYVPATVRETVNAKALKAENPEIYKRYVKVSNVQDTIKVTENGQEAEIEE